MFKHLRLLLLAAPLLLVATPLYAHGNPDRWSAESTDFGCWLTRWLQGGPDATGQAIVAIQIVLGQIIPPRGGAAQPGLSEAELSGALTLNVRITDPMLKDASAVALVRAGASPIQLERRQLEEGMGTFPSFFITAGAAEAAGAALRAGQVAAILVQRSDGDDLQFAINENGVRVGFAMYDACVAAKPKSVARLQTAP